MHTTAFSYKNTKVYFTFLEPARARKKCMLIHRQFDVLYNLSLLKTIFEKKLCVLEAWFSANRVFGIALAVEIMLFGFSMADYLPRTKFWLESDFQVGDLPS